MSSPEAAHILVVDDESDLRELLTDALSADDLRVTAVATGQEAVELAGRTRFDFVVADLLLGDCTGTEVLEKLRSTAGQVPAIVISGTGDVQSFCEASRYRPVELMTKPLDVGYLRSVIRGELARQTSRHHWEHRLQGLRTGTAKTNRRPNTAIEQLQTTCADLAEAYEALSGRMAMQDSLLNYQHDLIAARNDDDVYGTLFRLFVRRSGPLFGVAMVCDDRAQLEVIGRFGVPRPDSLEFCRLLGGPIVQTVLNNPHSIHLDATEKRELFDESIRRYLVGVNILAIPLMPSSTELIGLTILYRKGEQPFTGDDLLLAEIIAAPTAVAIQRNS